MNFDKIERALACVIWYWFVFFCFISWAEETEFNLNILKLIYFGKNPENPENPEKSGKIVKNPGKSGKIRKKSGKNPEIFGKDRKPDQFPENDNPFIIFERKANYVFKNYGQSCWILKIGELKKRVKMANQLILPNGFAL